MELSCVYSVLPWTSYLLQWNSVYTANLIADVCGGGGRGGREGMKMMTMKSKYYLQLKSENNFRLLDGDHVLITWLDEVKYEWLN